MKKLLLFMLAAMAFAACTQNEVEELTANRADAPETLTVGFEGDDTRIELNEVCKTVWSAGDEASVFYHSNANQRWAFQGETGDRIGTLKRVANAEATAQMTNVVVVYPYNTNYWLNYANGNIEAMLPAVQSYKEGSYGADGNIMVAQSEFTQFSLKSVCGWLRVELTGKRHIVNSITLRGNAGEQVAGLIYVDTATAEATLASEMGEASDEEQVGGVGGGLEFDDTIFREVTLDCGSGVMLGAEATAFYIALLPQTFEKGMTIDIDYANAEPQTLVCDSSITIRRNHISPIESEANVEIEVPTNELWYTATALVVPKSSAFNVAIISNEWNEATGEGVITFDGELTEIGYMAFRSCTNLTSVIIPDSVTTIGWYAFESCDSLTSVTIPDSVTTIGWDAFENCDNLTSVYITDVATWCNISFDGGHFSNPLTNGAYLYLNNELVTDLTIPDSVTWINDYAFYGCDSLTSVTIPDSVTWIGYAAFAHCSNLISVYCKAIIPPPIQNDVFDENYTDRKIYAYEECVDIYKAAWSEYADSIVTGGNIPESVTTTILYTTSDGAIIDASKFPVKSHTYNNGVGELILYGELTTIPYEVFKNYDTLTTIIIPDSVMTIRQQAFDGCSSLTSVTIGNSVTTIGYGAFANCKSLTEFKGKFAADGGRCLIKDNAIIAYAEASGTTYTIPDYVTTIGDGAFSNCNSLTSVTIPDSVTTIGEGAFRNCDSLTSVTIPDSVTAIGDFAFSECHSLTRVTIPDSVTAIGDWAFSWCDCLTSVTITDSVTAIGEGVFFGCYSLTSVVIPSSVTMIGGWAFQDCDSLTSVTIPDSVTTIGYEAFYNCDSLTSVYCEATTPPTLSYYVFDANAAGRKIYIPAESVEAYKTAENWSEYATDILAYDFETGEVVDTTPANEL